MIDLQKFCENDRETTRPWSLKPFSIGEWTYATCGRVLVRVPRRDDIPENPDANPQVSTLFDTAPPTEFMPAPAIVMPDADQEECHACDGRGTEHDCPSCQCQCVGCGGTGIEQPWHDVSFEIGEGDFGGKYVAKLRDLPGLKFGKATKELPMRFAFDGGEGLLMPRRGPCGTSIKLELKAA